MDIRTVRDSVGIQVRMILSMLYACWIELEEKQFILKAVGIISKISGIVYEEVLCSGERLFPNQWKRVTKLVAIS